MFFLKFFLSKRVINIMKLNIKLMTVKREAI